VISEEVGDPSEESLRPDADIRAFAELFSRVGIGVLLRKVACAPIYCEEY
jgi:hypothetical protein